MMCRAYPPDLYLNTGLEKKSVRVLGEAERFVCNRTFVECTQV